VCCAPSRDLRRCAQFGLRNSGRTLLNSAATIKKLSQKCRAHRQSTVHDGEHPECTRGVREDYPPHPWGPLRRDQPAAVYNDSRCFVSSRRVTRLWQAQPFLEQLRSLCQGYLSHYSEISYVSKGYDRENETISMCSETPKLSHRLSSRSIKWQRHRLVLIQPVRSCKGLSTEHTVVDASVPDRHVAA
jgi:hypothetical protein